MKCPVLILAACLAAASHAASAAPPKGCSGILHGDKNQLLFGGAKGEGEGICVVTKAEETKVSAICSVGHFCRVQGKVEGCKDSGECAEISSITKVSRKRK